jgi:MarR family protease production transcriptional regulator HPr
MELMAIVRNIYGDDFMEIFETSFNNVDQNFTEKDGKIIKKPDLEKEFI